MSSLPFTKTSELGATLKQIETDTETVFLELGRALPELVTEMKRSLQASEEAIDAMEHGGEGASRTGTAASSFVADTRRAVEGWVAQFQELSRRDTTLFEQLRTAIGNLEKISSSIKQIKLDSEDMEIVSLNAMTVALKAGSSGQAFSYITEELKRLSNRTVSLSDEISRHGKELTESFSHFEQELEETRSLQEQLLHTFQTRMMRSFEDFESAVEGMIEGSRDLRTRSMDLQHPINRMMEAIQLQDLIRQSIEHIVLALDVIEPEESLSNSADLLDELAFLRDIPKLAISLIDDVANQIEASTATFFSLTEEAEAKLESLEQERRDFMTGAIRTTRGEEISFEELMRNMSSILDELVNDLNTNLDRKKRLTTRSEEITHNVEDLQTTFRTFNTLVNRFHSIDIAARIEVAKQSVLREMENSTEHMSVLTKKIARDVEDSLRFTRDFIDTTAGVMESYRSAYREELQFSHSFQTDMRRHHEELQEGRESLATVIGGFTLFTDRFFSVFSRSKRNGEKLHRTSETLRGLTGLLEKMETDIENRYRQVLHDQGLEEWAIENTRLQDIIKRFTIFTHKQHAGAIAGFEVEEGTASGDVTLF